MPCSLQAQLRLDGLIQITDGKACHDDAPDDFNAIIVIIAEGLHNSPISDDLVSAIVPAPFHGGFSADVAG